MSVKIEGLEAVTRKLESLNKPGVFQKPMRLATDHLYSKLKRDVTKAAGAFSAMATEGQRRAYWAKVRSGEAQHGPRGYVRSGRLYRGWTKKITNGGRRGIVENDVDYADYVQGERQQPFHAASRYPRIDRVAKDEQDRIVKIFEREYERQLNK